MSNELSKLDVILLWALPGSGKSELLKFLKSLTAEQRTELGLGDFEELDDYPMVAKYFQIDDARERLRLERQNTKAQTYDATGFPDDGGLIGNDQWNALDVHLAIEYEHLMLSKPNLFETSTLWME